MGLAIYGDGNASSIIICDECRRAVTTTMGPMSTAAFEMRAREKRCLPLLGHALLVRAQAFASGWSENGGVWRCVRCSTEDRRAALPLSVRAGREDTER
jgi:hypothetical protein